MTKQCRVCFESENADRALCSPCACAGTIKWICTECMMVDTFRHGNPVPGRCTSCGKMYHGVAAKTLEPGVEPGRDDESIVGVMMYIASGSHVPNVGYVPPTTENAILGAKFVAKIFCMFLMMWAMDQMAMALLDCIYFFVSRSDSIGWIVQFLLTLSIPVFLCLRLVWNCFSIVLQIALSLSAPEHRHCLTLLVIFRCVAHFVPSLYDLIKPN